MSHPGPAPAPDQGISTILAHSALLLSGNDSASRQVFQVYSVGIRLYFSRVCDTGET